MRILLFAIGIYNTFEDATEETFKQIIDKLEKLADIDQDQVILISFCDETTNRDVLAYFYRKILDYIEYKKIYLGRQFLGDVYYKNIINSGAILYDEEFNKEREIFKYAKKLEDDDNFVNLYYFDSSLDIDKVNEMFKGERNIDLNVVNGATNSNEVIHYLDEFIKNKKSLELK